MNYIRGAVNAISAPYQYYKELPPINPSTLTGAIDVIVLQRPTADGGSELVCSPFHVRFGKWQVLRPGEKKVNVSVNGHPIPFPMKIGEAGEAFFVFETDSDVPDELITSPLLQPTQPDELPVSDVPTREVDVGPHPDAEANDKVTEPEFLDLDAIPSPSSSAFVPSSSQAHIEQAAQPSPPLTPTFDSYIPLATPSSLLSRTPQTNPPQDIFNQLSKHLNDNGPVIDITYANDVVLDPSGYHSHQREDSDRTVVSDLSDRHAFPAADSTQSSTGSNFLGSPPGSSDSDELGDVAFPFPPQRATSEPPPDLEDQQRPGDRVVLSLDSNIPVQEYSWEWGAFPQPSPMNSSFGRRFEGTSGNRSIGKGKLRLPTFNPHGQPIEEDVKSHRSRSVPPELEGSPTMKRREISTFEDDDYDDRSLQQSTKEDEQGGFGFGGRLTSSRTDPTQFTVCIEKRKVGFELSLVSREFYDPSSLEEMDQRGRRNENSPKNRTKPFHGLGEVEAARIFNQGKVNYHRFLDEELIVKDERLVIRWSGDQYITRNDGSPLMDALILWRDATINERARGLPSRPASPFSDEDDMGKGKELYDEPVSSDELQDPQKAESDLQEPRSPARKPTSSSWSRWWRRGQIKDAESTSGWPKSSKDTANAQASPPQQALPNGKPHGRGTAPVSMPTSPRIEETPTPSRQPVELSKKQKKFAKTLRLSSDQLRTLNLKPGANAITFSLSASGAIACTARIFVWDSTDLVVISDIDGTITKSDGLGHVFAMIGRDWTHVGVAKLYTDIVRNGYKIMYLTSRAIGQADATRGYLKGIKQNDYQLPEGPVIMSPDRLMASLHREVIMRKPELFKMACLRDIQRLFGEASHNPFYAGFGNRITDALSYRSVDVPSARIFTIDSSGEVKMELLELAGYKSSYIHMTDLVDQMFPPIHRKWATDFTDFNYWKTPVQEFPLPDLTPPSPALSARSDTSNQSTFSRLRNFSLVGSRQSRSRLSILPPPGTDDSTYRSTGLKQMSSFERLSSTLASFTQSSSTSRRSTSRESRTSTSLTYADSGTDDEYIDDDDLEKGGRRLRRRSMVSMPGSLDDIRFEVDDEGDDEGENGDVEDCEEGGPEDELEEIGDEEGATEEAFDEDFLATTQMKNVPFL